MARCPDCNGDNFVMDYKEGDVVCTGCGLVQERILVDDGIPRDVYTDPETISAVKMHDRVKSACCHLGLEAYTATASAIFEDAQRKHGFRGACFEAAVAASIYVACQVSTDGRSSRDATEIFPRMGVEASMFFKVLKLVYNLKPDLQTKAKRVTEDDILIRQIQQADVHTKDVHTVIRKVRDLDAVRRQHGIMLATSPKIVNAVLIFAAADALGIHVEKHTFVNAGWVSRATLDKHAKAIKALAKKNM